MGYIKKLKNNELVGGTDKTTIYPVTSAEAVFEEVSDNEFKSQKYLNNHITNERIVDNTIENRKLKDDTIDMGKLNTQLKTTIQNAYDASWKVKKEPFSLETKYDANDVVYDPDTNSSYVSLTADNQGNPVNPEDEGYVEGKWRIVINGISAVQATEEIEETKEELIDYIQGNLKDQVDDEIADAKSRVAAAEKYAQGVVATAETMAQQITDWSSSEISSTPSYTDQHPLSNRASTAQIGYYACSGGSGATIIVDDTDAAAFTPVKGGQVKILMAQKSAVTSGNVQLQFGSVTATKKVLLYNKETVSASNSWDAGEVLSVYYDGTYYQASNAQGGSNKKIDAYLLGDLNTFKLGQTYNENTPIVTTDKRLLKVTKDIKLINVTDTVSDGDIKVFNTSTYQAQKNVDIYTGDDSDYSQGDYAIGSYAEYILEITAGESAGNITVNGITIAIAEGETAAEIAAAIVSNVAIEGWTLAANDNTVSVKCNTIGNNTTTITFADTDSTGVTITGNSTPSVAGNSVVRIYDGSAWTNAAIADYVADTSMWASVNLDFITDTDNGVTKQNSVQSDIKDAVEIEKEINTSSYAAINYAITSSGTWSSKSSRESNRHIIIPVIGGRQYKIVCNTTRNGNDYAWLTSDAAPSAGNPAPIVHGTGVKTQNSKPIYVIAPSDAKYIYFRISWDSSTYYYPDYMAEITNVKERIEELTNIEDLAFNSGEIVRNTDIVSTVKANSQDLVSGDAVFEKFKGIMQPVSLNFTSYLDTQRNARWTDGTQFSSSTAGSHVAIPVLDNYETVNILGHSSRGSFYVFVRSYEVPTSAARFDLCKGETGRKTIAANTSTGSIKIPGDCKYIIIGILNDSNVSYKPQSVAVGAYTDVNYASIISDIYMNTLRSSLPDEQTTGDMYWGDKIKVDLPNRTHYCTHYGVGVSGIGNWNGLAQQGLAIYDNYAFVTYDTGYIVIVDMITKTMIGEYEMPEGVYGPNNHAGNANFSTIFYESTDPFPLLYISSYLEHCCYVLRVTLEGCSLVQTIYASQDGTESVHTGTWHFYVDNDGRIIIHGNYGFCLGTIPPVSTSTAYINIDKCINFSEREIAQGLLVAGSAARNGNLYINAYSQNPGGGKSYSTILVYNYEQRRLASRLTVPSNIHGWEFEGLAFYGNQIVVGYNGHDQFMVYSF